METQPQISQPKLRRIAERVPAVFERHKPASPALAAREPTLLPIIGAYVEVHDLAASVTIRCDAESKVSADKVGELHRRLRTWIASLDRDVAGFDGSEYSGEPSVAEDVIVDAKRLIEAVRTYNDASGAIPYAAQLVADLQPALSEAQEARSVVQASRVTRQELQATVRERGLALQRELVILRRILRTLLGTRHRDYRLLRNVRGRTLEEEEVVAVPAPSPAAEHGATAASANGTELR